MARHLREIRQWDTAHGGQADPEVFRREILPGLEGVSLNAMAKATGLSAGYCSFVRRGLKIPHRRHWESLGNLARKQKLSRVHSVDTRHTWNTAGRDTKPWPNSTSTSLTHRNKHLC